MYMVLQQMQVGDKGWSVIVAFSDHTHLLLQGQRFLLRRFDLGTFGITLPLHDLHAASILQYGCAHECKHDQMTLVIFWKYVLFFQMNIV